MITCTAAFVTMVATLEITMSTSGGSITVHRRELCSALLGTPVVSGGKEQETETKRSPERGGGVSPVRAPSRGTATAHIEDWLSRKARRAVVALPDDPDLTAIKDLCMAVLDEERTFFSELESFICSEEAQDQCKKEMLYQKWSERVFAPIQQGLASQMGGSGCRELDHKKRRLFSRYLSYRNRKAVFLDTISSEEYDPLLLSRGRDKLTVTTGCLDDPLISQATDNASEKRMVKGCEEGLSPGGVTPPSPLGREDTNCVLWLAMQLVHIDSEARGSSRNRMLGVRNDSHFDKKREAEPTAELVKQELKIPHKHPIHHHKQTFKLEWKDTKQK